MTKYKAVIFDLDGTLLNTSEGIISSVKYTIEKMGFEPLDEDVLTSFIGPPVQNSFQRVYNLDEETKNKVAAIFREHYSTVDLCKAKLYDGVIETLAQIRQKAIKIGVATYKRKDYARTILDEFGISEYCDSIVGSDFEGKFAKSDIINICIDSLHVEKSDVVMVGDTEHDLFGAQNIGVDFLAVTYGFGFKTISENVCKVNCFTEIFDCLFLDYC